MEGREGWVCGQPMLGQEHLWVTVIDGWHTLELRAVTSEKEERKRVRNRDWFKKLLCTDTDLLELPIVPSMRLRRTDISVVEVRAADMERGGVMLDWSWTCGGGWKMINFFLFFFNCLCLFLFLNTWVNSEKKYANLQQIIQKSLDWDCLQ